MTGHPENKSILIVDDEDYIRDLLREILSEAGYTVLEAASGPQALSLFSRHHSNIGLVLLDVILPDMDGRDVYFKLKSLSPDIKIIIVSGYSQAKIRQELFDAGVEGYITKPFDINRIRQLIQSVLGAD